MFRILPDLEFTSLPDGSPSEPNPAVPTVMRQAVEHTRDFVSPAAEELAHQIGPSSRRVFQIDELRRAIQEVPGAPEQFDIEGMFFPAVLLCSGWWERRYGRTLADTTRWTDNLQHWLFSGFERWGPSLDVNPAGEQRNHYLLGQIGRGDEADSLLIIIAAAKAQTVQERLMRSVQAFRIRATGLLCHRNHIPDAAVRRHVAAWGASFDYCLLVSAENKEHSIHPLPDALEMYSGYLWQCWLPREHARYANSESNTFLLPPRLTDVYFTWEHTDLSNESALSYNIDSLQHKVEFLRRRFKDLILVQKSSDLLLGDQALTKEDFYQLFMRVPIV
jgi:hypothetical protein